MPRSCRRSSTLRSESGKRTYSITAKRMISGLVLKYLNGECFVIRRGYETTLPVSSSFCLTVALGQPYAANRSPTPDPCSALSGSEWPQWETAYRKADDFWARFKVSEWRVFCHMARLRNRPPRLKFVLFDGAFSSVNHAMTPFARQSSKISSALSANSASLMWHSIR